MYSPRGLHVWPRAPSASPRSEVFGRLGFKLSCADAAYARLDTSPGGSQVSEPRGDRGQAPARASEAERERILARAKPLPPVEETIFDDLTDEQDRIFWETITSA